MSQNLDADAFLIHMERQSVEGYPCSLLWWRRLSAIPVWVNIALGMCTFLVSCASGFESSPSASSQPKDDFANAWYKERWREVLDGKPEEVTRDLFEGECRGFGIREKLRETVEHAAQYCYGISERLAEQYLKEYGAAIESLAQRIDDVIGHRFGPYAERFREEVWMRSAESKLLVEKMAFRRKVVSEMERMRSLNAAFNASQKELRSLSAPVEESGLVNVRLDGAYIGSRGMEVNFCVTNVGQQKLIYVHTIDRDVYVDDNGERRVHRSPKGIAVVDNFGNRIGVREVFFGASSGDRSVAPGKSLSIGIRLQHTPPDAAEEVRFTIEPGTVGNTKSLSLSLPSRYVREVIRETWFRGD